MTRKYSAILPLKPERFPVAFWVLLALTAGCDPCDRELSAGEARKQIEQVFRSDMGEPWTLAPPGPGVHGGDPIGARAA